MVTTLRRSWRRNLKTFVKNGRRYRVVYTSPDKKHSQDARKMYDDKVTALHFDYAKGHWLVGVRPKK